MSGERRDCADRKSPSQKDTLGIFRNKDYNSKFFTDPKRQNINMFRNFSSALGEIEFNCGQRILKGDVNSLNNKKPKISVHLLGTTPMDRFRQIGKHH